MHKHKTTIVDLFCGCGGFSLGAELAGLHSLVAVDIDPTLQSAYRRNFPQSKTVQVDVADLDATSWRLFLGKQKVDGIIGGPPCQGFSRIGKRKKDDPRNDMIGHYFRQVDILRPKFFVMENVEGLLDEKNIHRLSEGIDRISAHYQVLPPFIVNAADFGAATKRRRVVVIGYTQDDVDPFGQDLFNKNPNTITATVNDAISDLPAPIPETKNKFDLGWTKYKKMRPDHILSDYAIRLRQPPPNGLGCPESIKMHAAGFVSGMFSTKHTLEVAARYAGTSQGKCDKISKSLRLAWEGQCPTLRAGTGSEKGAFQAVRPIHPEDGRVITVREAARMQGFPDWFVFHPTKWHSFRMIGNSVSPIVSYGLFSKILLQMSAARAA